MPHHITRRTFLIAVGGAAVLPTLGCKPRVEPEKVADAVAKVAIVVGNVTMDFNHWAARITGVTLYMSGHLVVLYIDMDGQERRQLFGLSAEHVDVLRAAMAVIVMDEDGERLEVAIDEFIDSMDRVPEGIDDADVQ